MVQRSDTGLGQLDAQHPQRVREDTHQRYEKHTLPGHGQEGCGHSAADGLERHVAHHHPALKTEGDALKAQGGGAVPDDLRVIPEEGDQLGGKDEAQDAHGQEEHGSGLDAEEKALRTRR